MAKFFNITGACKPNIHYMVNLESRLKEIKTMVDRGLYFTINRARQYGKTTTLRALSSYLQNEYIVVSLDFQDMTYTDFENEAAFVNGLAREIHRKISHIAGVPTAVNNSLLELAKHDYTHAKMTEIFGCFIDWCSQSEKPVVLIIDEVDSATNNQIFLDFLAKLRAAYLDNDITPTFQSVILAGVHDVRNIKRKIRPDEAHKVNSPWNIASKFLVDMSFSAEEIAEMLTEYEADCHTGMNIEEISRLLYNYTSGYPYLVSTLCKSMDEEIAGTADFPDKSSAWTKQGFLEAEKALLMENNTLFQSLTGKLLDYPELRSMLYDLLFTGRAASYVPQNQYIEIAAMYGFIKNNNGTVAISNRIFETLLYNLFISEEYLTSKMTDAGELEKNQFITGGHLNVRRVLEKFVETFDDLYGNEDEAFLENVGRRYFMLFLKPIINGVGNSYVEAETHSRERTDLVIDYRGEQFIIEIKLWRGNAYHERGEQQLSDYLDHYHLNKGYMLSFNFNKKKEVGVKEIVLNNKILIEAVV